MRVPCRTLTLAVCAWLLVSCARSTFQRDLAELQREKAAEREEWQQQAELLSRRGEVNTVLAAALIEYAELKRSERALALLARALELETARPEIAWIDLRLCQEVASCDTRSRVTRLQSIDPENAAGWYGELRRAQEAGDVQAEDAALAGMGAASRFDIHWNRTIVRVAEALRTPDPSTGEPLHTTDVAIDYAADWVMYLSMPALQPVSDTCKGDRLQRSEVVQQCRSVIPVLEAGDTYAAEALGFAIGRRVWAEGSPERDALEQRRLRSQYHRHLAGQLLPGNLSEAQTAAWLRLLQSHEREQDAFQMLMRENGHALAPPADWTPTTVTN